MRSVYALTLRQLAGRWRIAIMIVLAGLPVLMTALVLATGESPSVAEFEQIVLNGMLAGAITPLVVLAIATAAFGNEVEDMTLANLTLSPLPRWKLAVPKMLASFTVAAPFIAASAITVAHLAYLGDATATAAVTAALLAQVALYAAAFTWLGLASPTAIGLGLLYVVLWEGLFAGFVQGVRGLSIRYWSLGLMHAFDERRFAHMPHMDAWLVGSIAALAFAGFVALTVRRLRRMDVP